MPTKSMQGLTMTFKFIDEAHLPTFDEVMEKKRNQSHGPQPRKTHMRHRNHR